MRKSLLLAGSTGLIGSEVLKLALNDQRYSKIHLLLRKSTGISHPKIVESIINFEHLDTLKSDISYDDVIISLGTTIKKAGSKAAFERVDLSAVVNTASWAYRHGAKKCALISSVGADAKSMNFYLSTKGKAEDGISTLGFQSLLIFRPSLLLGDRNETRLGEKFAQNVFGSWTQNFKLFGKYTSIESQQVAKAVIESLNSDLQGKQILHFDDMKKFF